MIKPLIFLAVFVMLFSAGGVLAVDQPINGTISSDIVCAIGPATVIFGPITPGTNGNAATNGPITFNATGSNVDVAVTVTSVTGSPFSTGLRLDGADPISRVFNLDCVVVSNICTYSIATTTPTLNVPKGSPAGLQTGIITYTVAEKI
jgi:hypothetical protein